MATLPTLDHFQDAPEVRPLPSASITRPHRYYEPVRHPTRPSLSLAGSRLGGTPPTAGVSRVAWTFRMQTCRRHYPGGNAGGVKSFPLINLASAAFPIPLLGRLPHYPFRGLLGVHSRYGLPARGVAETTLSIEGFDSIVTSTAAPIATGWNDELPGGNCTH